MDLTWASTFLYKQLYSYDSIRWGTNEVELFGQKIEIPWVNRDESGPNPNDTMVSVESANGAAGAVNTSSLAA
ncbi:MAG TPA: hypothetical protein VGA03_06595, partial [Anaerolineales bacterium]